MRRMIVAALVGLWLVAACGQKGALVLPDQADKPSANKKERKP